MSADKTGLLLATVKALYLFMKENEYRKDGRLFAFTDKDGKAYLIRCFKCEQENYLPAVATGQCAWCFWQFSEEALKNETR